MTRKEVEKLRDLYLKLTFDPSRCRFNKPGEHFSDRSYTVEVQEATRVFRASWILPELAAMVVRNETEAEQRDLVRRVATLKGWKRVSKIEEKARSYRGQEPRWVVTFGEEPQRVETVQINDLIEAFEAEMAALVGEGAAKDWSDEKEAREEKQVGQQ